MAELIIFLAYMSVICTVLVVGGAVADWVEGL